LTGTTDAADDAPRQGQVVVPATVVTEQHDGEVIVAESFVGPMPPPHYLERYLGLVCGFGIAIAFGWFAYRLGQQGHDGLAVALGGADLASLVAIFVLGFARGAPEDDDE
jgi:hypothetical protein